MIALLIITGILLVLLGIGKMRQMSLDNFRREAQKGYIVQFYHHGCLISGTITECDETTVVIKSKYGTHKRFREDIYF